MTSFPPSPAHLRWRQRRCPRRAAVLASCQSHSSVKSSPRPVISPWACSVRTVSSYSPSCKTDITSSSSSTDSPTRSFHLFLNSSTLPSRFRTYQNCGGKLR
ncbi:hypothetical protein BOTBODRAFT_256257 [Botryobasidium botryosum FD-172 SS1]|uniref:Uncharacterized protein n=1 Tax=Botryobasidium botryosum (strain FD-172 SS1) TaxID=930990 RepID=A0A067LSQ1_BOTB1|nr:hypothetical protein BOTBODRAFT_256257 [Botryobasidium botryosum FD-172 SS1]